MFALAGACGEVTVTAPEPTAASCTITAFVAKVEGSTLPPFRIKGCYYKCPEGAEAYAAAHGQKFEWGFLC